MLVLNLFTLLFTIMERGSTVSAWKGDCLCTWKHDCLCMWKGNHLCWSWGINDWCREDQYTTFTWKIQKIKLIFPAVGIKLFTLLFTVDTERINSLCMWKDDQLCVWKGNHLCMWKGNCLCAWKRQSPLHMKRQLPLHMKRQSPLCNEMLSHYTVMLPNSSSFILRNIDSTHSILSCKFIVVLLVCSQ